MEFIKMNMETILLLLGIAAAIALLFASARNSKSASPDSEANPLRFRWNWNVKSFWRAFAMWAFLIFLKCWLIGDRDELPFGQLADKLWFWRLPIAPIPSLDWRWEIARAMVASVASFGTMEIAFVFWALAVIGPQQLRWRVHIPFWAAFTAAGWYFGPHPAVFPFLFGGIGMVFAAPLDPEVPGFRTWMQVYFWLSCGWTLVACGLGWDWTAWPTMLASYGY